MTTDLTARTRVDDQLCFALQSASRAVTGAYRIRLSPLGLTYPQYLTLLAIWEQEGRTVSELGAVLHLDSGTLSPILRRLERGGWIRKERSPRDERSVHVVSTPSGQNLQPKVAAVRTEVEAATGLSHTELISLRSMVCRVRDTMEASRP